MFETNRLILRDFSIDDCYDVYDYAKDPIVAFNAGWLPHKNLNESINVIVEQYQKNRFIWAIVLKSENRVIGLVSLRQRKYMGCEVGYVLNSKYWGNGYALEALNCIMEYGFMIHNVNLITCLCFGSNNRSKNLAIKAGFKYQGLDPKSVLRLDNKIEDMCIYALSKEEYINERIQNKI